MPVWLLFAWGRIKSATTAILSVFTRWPRECAIAVLIVAVAWFWQAERHVKADLAAANARIKAGEQNVTALKADKARTEQRQAAVTERIDHETVPARRDALAASDDYARTHRCLQSSSPIATASQPGGSVPGVPAATGSAEASGPASELVAIAKPDLDACTLNTTDLQKAFEWAQSIAQP